MKLNTKDTIWAAPKNWAGLITSEDIPGNEVYAETPIKLVDGVAIVDISGVLLRDEDVFCAFFGGASTERISRQITECILSSDVKSILLFINSPGGQVNGTAELADQVFQARQKKPIVAYVSGDGYSAAYWIASQASKIFMHEAAGAGAIGVCYPVETENYTHWLVSDVSPNKKPEVADESSQAQMQVMLNDLGEIFVKAVARGRGVDESEVSSRFGGGDIFIAAKAVDKGLADEVGSFETALAYTKTATIQAPEAEEAAPVETAKKAIIQNKISGVRMANRTTPSAEMVDTADITVEWLKSNLPELYDQIVTEAQDSETNRQTELDAMTPENEDEKMALSAARKNRKINAAKLAYDWRLGAQAREQAKIKAVAQARADESASVVVPVTPEATQKTPEQAHDARVKAAMEKKAAAFKGGK